MLLFLLFLQAAPIHARSYAEYFFATGFIGLALLALVAVGACMALRRFLELRTERLAPEGLQRAAEKELREGRTDQLLALAREKRTLLGVLIEAGLASSAGGLADMLAGVERATARESLRLGNRVANLARLGGALILVGLLGTVMDLLSTANVLMILLEPTWSDFIIGFSEALSCTGFGLLGALLCFTAYFWLESRLVQQTLAVSEIAEELMREAARRG